MTFARVMHRVSDKVLAALGDVHVSFSSLEFFIQLLAWRFLGGHQRIGEAVCSELSFANLRVLVLNLYRAHYDEDADFEELKALMNGAGKLEERRNTFTHSRWLGAEGDTALRFKTTARAKGTNTQEVNVSDADLRNFARELQEHTAAVRKFSIKLLSVATVSRI